ncbi:MAG TPA: group III truncated hemoglobin [Ferruginibacter sp.]|nr:group III truncated hemoglobin [Ferruginibacter sp.]
MKPDIKSRADIEKLIILFYEQVREDKTIGFIFNDVVNINWQKHISLITDFWETILLDNPVYKNNAMEVHYEINKILPLQPKHFESWLLLFYNSIDTLFEGKTATLAKVRAKSITDLMQFKMNGNKNKSTLL